MINSTLCYIERGDEYLMLHRTKKQDDLNEGMWIGFGGKFENGESPEQCLLREVREETGLTLTSYRLRGIVTFICTGAENEYMFLYTADGYDGEIVECNEGQTAWIKKDDIHLLPHWEGDLIFLRLIREDRPFFSLRLEYDDGKLLSAILDGKRIA